MTAATAAALPALRLFAHSHPLSTPLPPFLCPPSPYSPAQLRAAGCGAVAALASPPSAAGPEDGGAMAGSELSADAPALLGALGKALEESNADVRHAAAMATKAMAQREPTLAATRGAFVKVAVPALLQFQRGLNLALKQDGERTLLYLLRPYDEEGGMVAPACAHLDAKEAASVESYVRRVLSKLKPDSDDDE